MTGTVEFGVSKTVRSAAPIPQMKKNFVNRRVPHRRSSSEPNIHSPSMLKRMCKRFQGSWRKIYVTSCHK